MVLVFWFFLFLLLLLPFLPFLPCLLCHNQLTAAGLEANFAVNTLGTFVLTRELLPHLATHPDARVITVASGGMLLEKLEPVDLQLERRARFDGEAAYSQQKRQQVQQRNQVFVVFLLLFFF